MQRLAHMGKPPKNRHAIYLPVKFPIYKGYYSNTHKKITYASLFPEFPEHFGENLSLDLEQMKNVVNAR